MQRVNCLFKISKSEGVLYLIGYLFFNFLDLFDKSPKELRNLAVYLCKQHFRLQTIDIFQVLSQLVIPLIDALFRLTGLKRQKDWLLEFAFEYTLIASKLKFAARGCFHCDDVFTFIN